MGKMLDDCFEDIDGSVSVVRTKYKNGTYTNSRDNVFPCLIFYGPLYFWVVS